MLKKIMISLLVLFAIINIGSISEATGVDLSKYEIINPVEQSSSTLEKNILVNGKAPTGTNISIDVFITTDLTRKNFDLSKLPENKDYINRETVSLKAGNMGYFQHEISLGLGINKISLDFGVEGLEPREFIIYVFDNSLGGQNRNSGRTMIEIVPILK